MWYYKQVLKIWKVFQMKTYLDFCGCLIDHSLSNLILQYSVWAIPGLCNVHFHPFFFGNHLFFHKPLQIKPKVKKQIFQRCENKSIDRNSNQIKFSCLCTNKKWNKKKPKYCFYTQCLNNKIYWIQCCNERILVDKLTYHMCPHNGQSAAVSSVKFSKSMGPLFFIKSNGTKSKLNLYLIVVDLHGKFD